MSGQRGDEGEEPVPLGVERRHAGQRKDPSSVARPPPSLCPPPWGSLWDPQFPCVLSPDSTQETWLGTAHPHSSTHVY